MYFPPNCCTLQQKKVFLSFYAPLAQLVEQLTLNQRVLGSSPGWCTNSSSVDKAEEEFLFFSYKIPHAAHFFPHFPHNQAVHPIKRIFSMMLIFSAFLKLRDPHQGHLLCFVMAFFVGRLARGIRCHFLHSFNGYSEVRSQETEFRIFDQQE